MLELLQQLYNSLGINGVATIGDLVGIISTLVLVGTGTTTLLKKDDPEQITEAEKPEKSEKSENKYGKRNSIFNLIKNNTICNEVLPKNPNATNITNYFINCLKK